MEPGSLVDWNPWWNTGRVPENWTGRERDIVEELDRSMTEKDITVITGIRRSGKTTMVFQMVDRLLRTGVPPGNILFVNLSDASFMEVSLQDIASAYVQMRIPEGRTYFFLDEIQEMAGWERWALKRYELKRNEKIVVTGSSSALLTGDHASVLTGRTSTIRVFPLSFREYLAFNGHKVHSPPDTDEKNRTIYHLDRYLEEGGFPELQVRKDAILENMLSSYFNDIIMRDVLLHNKVDPRSILRFSKYILTNMSNPMSYRTLRNSTGLSVDTVKSYISILENVYLIWTVPHLSYSNKPAVEDQRPKKYYCIDNGLRNAVSFKFSKDSGRLAENLVFLQLIKSGRSLHYWKGKNEVDLVTMDSMGKKELINVCYSDQIPEREFRGLHEFIDKEGMPEKGISIITRDIERSEGDIQLIPLWKWLIS